MHHKKTFVALLCALAAAMLPQAVPAAAEPARVDLVEGLRGYQNLRSYFKSGPLAKAARLLRTGKCRPALRDLTRALDRREVPESLRGQAAFVAGLCAHRTADHQRAAGLFAEAAERYPALRSEAQYYLGDTLLRLGEPERAARALEQVPPESMRFEEARALWARALHKTLPPVELSASLLRFVAGHPLDASGMPALPPVGPPPRRQTGAVAAALAGDTAGPRTLYRRAEISHILARALDQSGDVAASIPHYLYTWARFPATSFATRAGERLGQLRGAHKSAQPDAYYRLLRSHSLIASGQGRVARRLLVPLLQEVLRKGPVELRHRIELALGVALARSGDSAPAMARFRSVALGANDPELRGEAAYRAAEVQARRRQVDSAVNLYREAGMRHAGTAWAPLALSDGGELARLYRREREAKALFTRLVTDYPQHPRVARAQWRLGWYAFRAGNFTGARDHFRTAVQVAPRGDEEMRSLYWLARADGELGNAARAAGAYRTLLRVYPISYYGQLAKGRIHELVAVDSATEEAQLAAIAGNSDGHARSEFEDGRLVLARELVRLDLTNEARLSLKRYEHGRGQTPGGMMALASLYHELSLDRRAHWVLRLRAHAYRQYPTRRELLAFWKQAYPRRFNKELEQAAARSSVPTPLLMGLVREESTFEPRAVSPQKAMGLTQVIWETATDMSRQLKLKLRGKGDLYNPRINAMLGARFLANLVKYYRDRSLLAIAAYNAGPGNVDRWLAARGLHRDGPVPEDEIVEDIPFEETRHYVRKVFGSFAAYAQLYYGERVAALLTPLGTVVSPLGAVALAP